MQISKGFCSLSSNKNASNEKKQKYAIIPNTVREDFIERISTKKTTIKQAAAEFSLNFSTAKAILHTYRCEGRIGKKKTRKRCYLRKTKKMKVYLQKTKAKAIRNDIKSKKKEFNSIKKEEFKVDHKDELGNFENWLKELRNFYGFCSIFGFFGDVQQMGNYWFNSISAANFQQ